MEHPAAPAVETTTIETTLTVDPDWIDYSVNHNDLFMSGYCGTWLVPIARTAALGWLVWEYDEGAEENDTTGIVAAWREGKELPAGWYRMDIEFAKKAWTVGVKHHGEGWWENGDADTYDSVVQHTLLGELRYN